MTILRLAPGAVLAVLACYLTFSDYHIAVKLSAPVMLIVWSVSLEPFWLRYWFYRWTFRPNVARGMLAGRSRRLNIEAKKKNDGASALRGNGGPQSPSVLGSVAGRNEAEVSK
jgi:hypothetical protein